MHLENSWAALEKRLKELAEFGDVWNPVLSSRDEELRDLGLVDPSGAPTDAGNEFFMAKFVTGNEKEAKEALAGTLRENQVVTAFCEKLWGAGEIPVTGAVSLLKRITASPEDASAKHWLEMMNKASLVAYNRNRPKMRVLYNPSELVPPDEEAKREKGKGHVISPETPFGNLLALRALLRSARGIIRWYEMHMPPKVLEVLHNEIEKGNVTEIRILSGPANVDKNLKSDFKRFSTEMKSQRSIAAEWRVLTKKETARHHDRHFFANGIARNLPPLNSILANQTGEILESSISPDDFDEWWGEGTSLHAVPV